MKITVQNNSEHIRPEEMLDWNKYDSGTIFQQYDKGLPSNTYYIACGPYEKRVVTIWFGDGYYSFSTDNKKSLMELLSHITVKVNKTVSFNIGQ
jgi:hypothetical protein